MELSGRGKARVLSGFEFVDSSTVSTVTRSSPQRLTHKPSVIDKNAQSCMKVNADIYFDLRWPGLISSLCNLRVSLCLCGVCSLHFFHHRDTENTKVAQKSFPPTRYREVVLTVSDKIERVDSE